MSETSLDKGEVTTTGLAAEAYIWALSPVLIKRYYEIARSVGAPLNRLTVEAQLTDKPVQTNPDPSELQRHGGGNVDTLYGYAWIDLKQEPVVLQVPDANGRYYSFQLHDAYQNTFGYVSRRATGEIRGSYAFTGPDWKGRLPDGVKEIKCPTSLILAYARTLIQSPDDFSAAWAFQGEYLMGPLSAYPGGLTPPIQEENALRVFPHLDFSNADATFFDEFCEILATYPPAPEDTEELRRFESIGIRPGVTPSRDPRFDTILASGIAEGRKRLKDYGFALQTVPAVNGWHCRRNIVARIPDPMVRASLNRLGVGNLTVQEAIYGIASTGPDGARLNGRKTYRLRFPAGQFPPANGFWSMTMYADSDTEDGGFTVVENPINRTSIGDRTVGLVYGADGSLEIQIQRDVPSEGAANWLPAPLGNFRLVLRTYEPSQAFIEGAYNLPPLTLVVAN